MGLVIWIVLHQAVRTLCDAEPSMCLYMLESSARLAMRFVAGKAPSKEVSLHKDLLQSEWVPMPAGVASCQRSPLITHNALATIKGCHGLSKTQSLHLKHCNESACSCTFAHDGHDCTDTLPKPIVRRALLCVAATLLRLQLYLTLRGACGSHHLQAGL